MYYVYFLELSNQDIYVGSTNDLNRRIDEHKNGKVISTSKFLPLKLKAYLAVETKKRSIELEKYFKTGSGKAIALKRFLSNGIFERGNYNLKPPAKVFELIVYCNNILCMI
jgi:predicted GIY-YIG superfamily endonuclease